MAIKHLSLKPKKIDDHAWWYEEEKGIFVVVHQSPTGIIRDIYIPWHKIRAALARLDKKETDK